MLREPHKPEQPTTGPRNPATAKERRFQIVKLEERIAPGGGHGTGSNATCGQAFTCRCSF
jgi:hypothetical protein